MSALGRFIGPRYAQLLTNWSTSAAVFGATGVAALLYGTEWKEVLQYVPVYSDKYKRTPPEFILAFLECKDLAGTKTF